MAHHSNFHNKDGPEKDEAHISFEMLTRNFICYNLLEWDLSTRYVFIKKTPCLKHTLYIVTSNSSHVVIEEELVRHSKTVMLSDTTIKKFACLMLRSYVKQMIIWSFFYSIGYSAFYLSLRQCPTHRPTELYECLATYVYDVCASPLRGTLIVSHNIHIRNYDSYSYLTIYGAPVPVGINSFRKSLQTFIVIVI